MKKLFGFILISFSCSAFAGNAWDGYITKIQAEGIGDNFNVIYLDVDITNSACQKTNDGNRLTIVNNAQQGTALAALMAGKKVRVMETGACNSAGLADVNYVMIYADQ